MRTRKSELLARIVKAGQLSSATELALGRLPIDSLERLALELEGRPAPVARRPSDVVTCASCAWRFLRREVEGATTCPHCREPIYQPSEAVA